MLSTDGTIENVEYRVSLTIDDYDLENASNCMEDYIKVIKGTLPRSLVVRRLPCKVPFTLIS